MKKVSLILKVLVSALLLYALSCTSTVRFSRLDGGAASYREGYTPNYVVTDSASIVDCLMRHDKTPYKYGGQSSAGMDCSGLVQTVFKECNRVALPRKAEEQAEYGVRVDEKYIRGGDLVFFKINGRKVDHVGICIGNNRFIHASNTGVRTDSMIDEYYSKRFVVAKRLFYE
ncbi:MAG: C40 family peptidase [Fibrobacteres bacterium]|nr:C40 family peptidase [Fibrobacterota bacterium]